MASLRWRYEATFTGEWKEVLQLLKSSERDWDGSDTLKEEAMFQQMIFPGVYSQEYDEADKILRDFVYEDIKRQSSVMKELSSTKTYLRDTRQDKDENAMHATLAIIDAINKNLSDRGELERDGIRSARFLIRLSNCDEPIYGHLAMMGTSLAGGAE
ncbi:predicted protein [Sclerotinia sclerotiorum 1980 UF-70]|uniref:Uncharacterized protein n=1 Tax=Sclerotinia sclerotiorum (strain ATCC 18683 / 1980 / Ss-1) TaxID=665079 RepID=A7ECY0_SCLS1|nr:predicted protein [Sclerotinia sclerotiorum 1980 UF-70]EDO00696.1 predicted protein [Sclerotinia sclerotiorum 1980 UF-70]